MDYPEHYEESFTVLAPAGEVFAFIDDHLQLSSHMSQSSGMMMGGKMQTVLDEGRGQAIGSHIRMKGSVLGIPIFLDEVVSVYNPPRRKIWQTVGNPQLLVIGNYQMGVHLAPEDSHSRVTIGIDYELPPGAAKVLGLFFGKTYAQWCVRQMRQSIQEHFT